MFQIFLASTLISKSMFLSSFVVGFEKPSFGTYYNASIVRDSSVILILNTCLFQNVVAKNYLCISLGRRFLIFSV
jgi:hypothetical protein